MDILDLARFVGLPVAVAALGVAVSLAAGRVLRGRIDDDTARLMELLARGSFAFAIFLLALTVAGGRETMSRVRDEAADEASVLRTLRREFVAAGGDRACIANLDGYARSVAADDWPALGARTPKLSARTEEAWQAFSECAVRGGTPATVAAVARLEHLRAERLEWARWRSPAVFWVVIGFSLAVGCVMYARPDPSRVRGAVLGLYLTMFGLAIALILELERPFGGLVSVAPTQIEAVLAEPAGNAPTPAASGVSR
jgi:hypothetical protein